MISKDYIFFASAKRLIFIEMPYEDYGEGDGDEVGRLNLSIYGIRDAPWNWQTGFSDLLVRSGFHKGRSSPCNFHHPSRSLLVTVPGDDFIIVGPTESFELFKGLLNSRYECKHNMLGPEKCYGQSIRAFTRVIIWTDEGPLYEADQRHGEIIIEQFKFAGAKPVVSLGAGEEQTKVAEDSPRTNEQERCQLIPDDHSSSQLFVIWSS